MQYKHILAAMK